MADDLILKAVAGDGLRRRRRDDPAGGPPRLDEVRRDGFDRVEAALDDAWGGAAGDVWRGAEWSANPASEGEAADGGAADGEAADGDVDARLAELEKRATSAQRANRQLLANVSYLRAETLLLHRALMRQGDFAVLPHDHPDAPLAHIRSWLNGDAKTAVLVFEGLLDEPNTAPTAIAQSLHALGCHVFTVADRRRCWHRKGLVGVTEDIDETAEFLRAQLPNSVQSVRTLGQGAGGFAAIDFGFRLKADRVLAFSPPIHLSPRFLKRRALDPELTLPEETAEVDLRRGLEERPEFAGRIDIHLSPTEQRARAESASLADRVGVSVHVHEDAKRNVVAALRQSGVFDRLLRSLALGD